MTVLKAGKRRQPFSRDKIIKSMQIALRKRPVELEAIEKAVNDIVRKLETEGEAEIPSEKIGELVMKALIGLDVVGYIRYASVYKDFRNPQDFNAFLDDMDKIRKKAG